MVLRTSDFFYEHGEEAETLLQILGEGRVLCNIDVATMRIYKFAVAVKVMKDTKACIFGRYKAKTREISQDAFNTVYNSLKKEAVRLDSNIRNIMFFEQYEGVERNIFYFQEYIEKEINDFFFLDELQVFCKEHETNMLKDSKKAS